MARRCRSAALAMSKAPFFAVDPRWWPDIAAELPLPWTESAVLADLRWHEDQVWAGLMSMPGARKLSKRWGWTHWQARQVLKAEESWRDGHTPKRVPHTGRTPAAQEPHTDRTDSERKPAESQEDAAHPPHTGRTPAAQKPPHARSTQHTSHSTHPQVNETPAWTPADRRKDANLSTPTENTGTRLVIEAWKQAYRDRASGPVAKVPPPGGRWDLKTAKTIADQSGVEDTPESRARLLKAVAWYMEGAARRKLWPHSKDGNREPASLRGLLANLSGGLAEVDAPQESEYQRNQRIMLETAARTIAELEAANG